MKNNIGIVGGVGPLAGVYLHAKIIQNTQVQKDQDHVPVYHISCSHRIGDRTAYFYDRTLPNPAFEIFEVIKQLRSLECRIIGIPCNTAHILPIREKIEELLYKHGMQDIQLLHIVEEVALFLVQKNISRVALLATKGTYNSKLYHTIFKAHGLELYIPKSNEEQELVHQSIYHPHYGIKAKSTYPSVEAKNILLNAAKDFESRYGAEAIIMGCTEIPLALSQDMVNISLIDSTDILAHALIRHSCFG